MTAANAPDRTGSATFKSSVPWSAIFRSRTLYALTLSYFTYGYVAWIFFAWFYIYLAQDRGRHAP